MIELQAPYDVDLTDEVAMLLPEREAPMTLFSINVAPVIVVQPVIVVGNAIAVQAATIGSSVTASLYQFVGISF